MTDATQQSDNSDTGNANQNNDQAREDTKTYTQLEFDTAMSGARKASEGKWEKKMAQLGGYETLKGLVQQAEESAETSAREKGDYDLIINKQKEKIATQSKQIEEFTISEPLFNAAAAHNARNPAMVVKLTRSNIRLNEIGDVVVIDDAGKTRLTDDGNPWTMDQLVESFLTENPELAKKGKASSTSNSSHVNNSSTKRGLKDLDLTIDADRRVYEKDFKNPLIG